MLYTRYHRRIASYIHGMVHDHARAEDIAQDVFMSALRRMRETDRPIAFKPWVYEIAKNACIDQFRRARRAEEVSMDADEGLGSADYGRLVSSTPTPDVAADHKQQIDHLRGAFGGLSETHHEILVMRELEGLSYREIGEKLGMTRPAVESTLFRARRRLTEEYDQLVTGERCVRVQQIITTAGGSALGARDKRRVARHVSYCQPCLRHARVSGLDARELVHKPIRAEDRGVPAASRVPQGPLGRRRRQRVAGALVEPGVDRRPRPRLLVGQGGGDGGDDRPRGRQRRRRRPTTPAGCAARSRRSPSTRSPARQPRRHHVLGRLPRGLRSRASGNGGAAARSGSRAGGKAARDGAPPGRRAARLHDLDHADPRRGRGSGRHRPAGR